MSAIHIILMGKGGVGKSFISTILAQHLNQVGNELFCADTDPTNPTFSGYPSLGAKHFNIMTPDMNIDKSHFDALIEEMLEHEGDCVVDNGASSFLPMMAYMLENDVIKFLIDAGKQVFIHAPLIGGLGMDETIRMLGIIIDSQIAPVVVWENELFGPVNKNGKGFLDSGIYLKNKSRILGIIKIANRSEDTFGKDLHNMTTNRLTFSEVMESPIFRTMGRQRLKQVQRDIAVQLDAINFGCIDKKFDASVTEQ
jgi:hypothetical protein